MSEMSSDESDIELPSALPNKPNKKTPKSPIEELLKKKPILKKTSTKMDEDSKEDKKLTTKSMIQEALIELKSRKGVSLYAIKKFLTEKYNVDTDKINYRIKKYIKSAVEDGSIVQLKGIGASGSFKLVPVKEKKKSKPKKSKSSKEDKENMKDTEKPRKKKEKSQKTSEKIVKSKSRTQSKDTNMEAKPGILKKKNDNENVTKKKKVSTEKDKKVKSKSVKVVKTPAKKKGSIIRRKSIGGIIKPPKMKPKAKP